MESQDMKKGDIVYFFAQGIGTTYSPTLEKVRIVRIRERSFVFCKVLKIFIGPKNIKDWTGEISSYHEGNLYYLNKLDKRKIIKNLYRENN